nr:hypothetical protein [Tanacetum cinerariifolium]
MLSHISFHVLIRQRCQCSSRAIRCQTRQREFRRRDHLDLNRAPNSPNQFHCFHCKDVLGDGEACKRCTCAKCGSGLDKGLCYICGHNQNSLNDSPRISETSSHSPPNINQCCYECGDPLDGIFYKRCTFTARIMGKIWGTILVSNDLHWQWELILPVGTLNLVVGMPCAFYSQHTMILNKEDHALTRKSSVPSTMMAISLSQREPSRPNSAVVKEIEVKWNISYQKINFKSHRGSDMQAIQSCGGKGRRGSCMAGSGGGWLAKCSIESNYGHRGGRLVVCGEAKIVWTVKMVSVEEKSLVEKLSWEF